MSTRRRLIESAITKIVKRVMKEEDQQLTTFYAFFNGKKIEVEASSLWGAKQKAIQQLKVPKSKEGLLSVISKKSYDGEEFRYN